MKKTLLGLALALATSTGAANAAPVYAESIVNGASQQGTTVNGAMYPGRSDATVLLNGDTTDGFYALGLGGWLVLDFGVGRVKTPGGLLEVTFDLTNYAESLAIYVSDTLTFSGGPVATVSNSDAQAPGAVLSFASGPFRYVKLVDTSTVPGKGQPGSNYYRDGFDVASISFSPVPVPAAGLMLAGAVAGLGALRRRAKKA